MFQKENQSIKLTLSNLGFSNFTKNDFSFNSFPNVPSYLIKFPPQKKVSFDVKLPILYLIDSIVKNVGDKYKQLFAQNIVNIFCGVFEKVKGTQNC